MKPCTYANARFKDFDSREGCGTLCHLHVYYPRYSEFTTLLGVVWGDCRGRWHWENYRDDTEGEEGTRRAAKQALRESIGELQKEPRHAP